MRIHSLALTLALTLALAPALAPGAAGQAQTKPAKADPDRSVAGGGSFPRGWTGRTDTKGKEADVKFVVMDPGWHITLGPAALLWRPTDKADGAFTATALVSQTKAPQHAGGVRDFRWRSEPGGRPAAEVRLLPDPRRRQVPDQEARRREPHEPDLGVDAASRHRETRARPGRPPTGSR